MGKQFKEDLIERLRDPEYAIEYLNACLADDEPEVFLLGLKYVVEAQLGGLSNLAEKTKLNRENLYRVLSKKGNPEFKSLNALLQALGIRFDLKLKNPPKKSLRVKAKIRAVPKNRRIRRKRAVKVALKRPV